MKWAFLIFVGLYIAALVLLAVGTFAIFGAEEDPLSAIFLLPLGLPWNIFVDKLGADGWIFPVAAPALNAAILFWLWQRRKDKLS